MFPAAVVAKLGTLLFLSSAFARETERALMKAKAELQLHLRPFDTAERELEARIDVAQAKLAKNRSLVA
jgi:hypothetical protein